MANQSAIQWTDATWNIARGCTKVDEDCKFCYMYRDSFDSKRYDPLQVVRTKTVFNMPLKYPHRQSACWPGRPLIFTCSLTDFFHEAIDEYRHEAWEIIRQCPHLIFQILTKRPERLLQCLPNDWGNGYDNVWLGTSCGSQGSEQRMMDLINIECKVRFLSLEPLHGRIELPADAADGSGFFDWVIVGGESGNENGKYRYRPCEVEWIAEIVQQCKDQNVPVFVKQMGTYLAKKLGMSDRHGGNINEFPKELQHRYFPISYENI